MVLAAMRHFRDRLVAEGLSIDYRALSATPAVDEPRSLGSALVATLGGGDPVRRGRPGSKSARPALPPGRPAKLIVVEPGEHRVREEIVAAAREAGIPLEIRTDRHFFSTVDEFAAHARGRKQLRLEWFYRPLREKHGVLMDDGEPAGGAWNFDADNRGAFPKGGPGKLLAPRRFPPDAVTRAVIELVNTRFAAHPGSLESFDWPVTPEEARAALDDFLVHRLPSFGRYQDAIGPASLGSTIRGSRRR
jgi:deoxyribodipyrimidine photolyase-related protein